ncbi:hypothetical protein [Arthrobacter sp. C152]
MIHQPLAHRPWTFAAICVMVTSLTLLLFGPPLGPLAPGSVIQLLPWYVAAYLLIGACTFGPAGKVMSLRQALAFLLPGALLVPLALLNVGFWAGGWLLGLPAWGLLLSRWTAESPLRPLDVLKFLGLLVLGLVIFTVNVIYPVFSLGLFLLPIVPLIRLAYPAFQVRRLEAAVEVVLAVATVVITFAVPTPEGSWSSPSTYAGGAATAGLIVAFWTWRLSRRSRRVHLHDGAAV